MLCCLEDLIIILLYFLTDFPTEYRKLLIFHSESNLGNALAYMYTARIKPCFNSYAELTRLVLKFVIRCDSHVIWE